MIKACVAKAKTLQDGEAETEKKREKTDFLVFAIFSLLLWMSLAVAPSAMFSAKE